MKNSYYFLASEREELEYRMDVESNEDGKTYSLYRIGESWTDSAKEEACVTIFDDGDGISFDVEDAGSYIDIQEFYIIIKGIINHDKNLIEKYKILK